MLNELENFIYGDGYGPTNEKLAAYTKDLFGIHGDRGPKVAPKGNAANRGLILPIWPCSLGTPASTEADPKSGSGPAIACNLSILQVLHWN